MQLSVVIPVFNDPMGLLRTIENVIFTSQGAEIELIVCNDGAISDVSKVVEDCKAKFRSCYIYECSIPERNGSYHARNLGIGLAKYENILLMDADIDLKRGWVEAIEKQSVVNDYIAFKVAMNVNSTMSIFKRYSVFTEFQTDAYWEQKRWGVTAFLFIKKSVFDRIGLFDNRMFSGGDFEFGQRVSKAQIPSTYVKEPYVFHAPRSVNERIKQQTRINCGIHKMQRIAPEIAENFSRISFASAFRAIPETLGRISKRVRNGAMERESFTVLEIVWAEILNGYIRFFSMWKCLIKSKKND